MSGEPLGPGSDAVRNPQPVSFAKPVPTAANAAAADPAVNKPGEQQAPQVGRAAAGLAAELLARYLVGRVLAARVSAALWIAGVGLLVLAMLIWIVPVHWLSILVLCCAVLVLSVRVLVMAVLRRIFAMGRLGGAEAQISRLVADTGGDLRRELRRVGLPGSVLGMPLLVLRIVGRRRRETLGRLAHFQVANVVPAARRSELEFIVGNLTGRGRAGSVQ